MPTNGPSSGLQQFDRLMHEFIRRQRLPGGSLSLAKDGRLVYARGFGWASKENHIPAHPGTLFGLASVSKAFTGAAIMKLVDQGRLNLEDKAFNILSHGRHIDPRAHTITIRQLLTHHAGYKDQPDEHQVVKQLKIPLGKLREDHLVASFMGRRLDHDPGTQEVYSNFGFVVLGAIIERIVGMPVGPSMHRLLFNPIGIHEAYYGHGGPHRPDTARPYDDDGKLMPAINIAGGSAGGLIASTVDIVRFLATLRGVLGRPFLSQEAFEEMVGPPKPPLKKRPNGTWVGLGFDSVHRTPKGLVYSKNGGMGGVRAVIGHTGGGIDWAVAFNGGRDAKGNIGVDAEAIRDVTHAVEQTGNWPDVDHFPAFAKPARPQ